MGLALRGGDTAWLKINLMPPELVNEARAIKRIPFLVAGGVAFLASLGVAALVQNRSAAVANAKLERVQARNSALSSSETKLKAEIKQADEATAKCDEFQQLLSSRSAALRRLQDVRRSLVNGMWITDWTAVPPPKDKPEAREAVKVTVRGWRDSMTKEEARWSSENAGKKSTAAEIVKSKIMRSVEFVPETV